MVKKSAMKKSAKKSKVIEPTYKLTKARKFQRPIVTEITAATEFWPAEEYHQKYFLKNGGGACHLPNL